MVAAAAGPPAGPAAAVRADVSKLCFQDAGLRRTCVAEWRGRVLLLKLWASWCMPCRSELPMFDGLKARLGSAEFDVVALSVDRAGLPAVHRAFAQLGIRNLTAYVDAQVTATEDLGARGIPTTLLIDRHGREIARTTGPVDWGRPEQLLAIQRALAEQ